MVRLNEEARSLFVSIDTTGERGELLLFVLLEELLGAPQVLCKMSLKTNPAVHFHGVDGIHIKAVEGGRMLIYWGEAKVYATFSEALSSCFKSLAPYLLDDGGGPSHRDLLLARTHLDTGNQELTERVVSYFVEGAADSQSREICGAALIGFGSDVYQNVNQDGSVDSDAIRAELLTWVTKIGGSVKGQKIESFRNDVLEVVLGGFAVEDLVELGEHVGKELIVGAV